MTSRWTVRSSTTVSPRRYGEKLLQKSRDRTSPRAPATIRMIPTVLMLKPEALTSTAKVNTAPTTSRKILTPKLTAARLLQACLVAVLAGVVGRNGQIDEPRVRGTRLGRRSGG